MSNMSFKYMGEVGEGRNSYILLVEQQDGQRRSYRINAAGKAEAVKLAEGILNCGLKVSDMEPRKKWRLTFKWGATHPAIISEIHLTKIKY